MNVKRARFVICASAALTVLALVARPARANAQLISPGKLSTAHAELEGVRGCTNCHELRKTGIANGKCLSCHEVLATRMTAGRGYHAQRAQQSCAECHKEHFGRDFEVVRLDVATFDHARTGYRLETGHTRVECRACHRAERIESADVQDWTRAHGNAEATYLGLGTACITCHGTDDPHGGQFGQRKCDACHSAGEWNSPVRFDHARTSYPLTGRHRDVECGACHPTERANGASRVRYDGVPATGCNACHTDPHGGAMNNACASCHETGGWKRVSRATVENRFDHTRTRFPLRGRHAEAACADCHASALNAATGIAIRYAKGAGTATYPRPLFDGCQACHTDYHERAFAGSPGGPACGGCHTESGWSPVSFDIERHARTAYPLTGAHIAVACSACHGAGGRSTTAPPGRLASPVRPKAVFRLASQDCVACHREHSPHGERFGERPCSACHETATFEVKTFDHALAGREPCRSCHASDNPHRDQFGDAGCETCHETRSYRIERFDHTRARFTLDGAHARVPCAGCHTTGASDANGFVRYRPLRTECTACHGGAT
jgi:hypothetical protein